MTATALAFASAFALATALAFATALFAAAIRGRVKLKRGAAAFNIRRAQRAATGLHQFFYCICLCCGWLYCVCVCGWLYCVCVGLQVFAAAALPTTKQWQRYQTAVLLMGFMFSAGAGAGTGTGVLLVRFSRLAQNVLQLHARVGSLGAHHVRHPRVGFFRHGVGFVRLFRYV